MVVEIMADLAWFLALFIVLCSSPGILRQLPLLARERETFWYLFCPFAAYGSVSFIGEEEEGRRRKKMTIFDLCGNVHVLLHVAGTLSTKFILCYM